MTETAAAGEECFNSMKNHASTFAKFAVPSAIDWGIKLYAFQKYVPQLKELCHFGTTVLSGKVAAIQDAYNSMSDSSKKLFTNVSKKIITEKNGSNVLSSASKNELHCDVNRCQQQIGRCLIWQEVLGSGILIATQVISVCQVWGELSKASNLTEKSRKQIPEINKIVEEMSIMFAELCSIMDQLKLKEDKDISQLEIMRIQLKYIDIDDVYKDTRRKISMIQCEVGGQIRTLEVYQKELVKDGIVNGFQVAAHLVEFLQVGSSMTGGLKLLKMSTTAIFAALTITKAVQYSISSDRLKELQTVWKELDELDSFLGSINVTIKDAGKWLASKLEQLQLLEAAQN